MEISERQESLTLSSILESHGIDVEAFLSSAWQRACAIFSAEPTKQTSENPYQEIINHPWDVLVQLLEEARCAAEQNPEEDDALLFKNLHLLETEERQIYDNSHFSAFLDGCSVVINHADILSPWIAELCEDLQLSFPHAYANTYLTPPGSQTVDAHADDRDVFIIQVLGAKQWTVFQIIPIPYPYTDEQVGKGSLAVPDDVLHGPVMISRTLHPGDVLYMPRGYVHQAHAVDDQPSFHITVALATHDWTLAGLMSTATDKTLKSVIDYRKALPREFGTLDWNDISSSNKKTLQDQLDNAFHRLRNEITIESIHKNLRIKYDLHNQRASRCRRQRQEAVNKRQPTADDIIGSIVGKSAASRVFLTSSVRAATEQEKANLPGSNHPRGLHVREEIYDGIMVVLNTIKQYPSQSFIVKDLRQLLPDAPSPQICDLTLLSFARQCVELGALALVK